MLTRPGQQAPALLYAKVEGRPGPVENVFFLGNTKSDRVILKPLRSFWAS